MARQLQVGLKIQKKNLIIIRISEFALFTKYGYFKQTVIDLFDAEFYTQPFWTESDGCQSTIHNNTQSHSHTEVKKSHNVTQSQSHIHTSTQSHSHTVIFTYPHSHTVMFTHPHSHTVTRSHRMVATENGVNIKMRSFLCSLLKMSSYQVFRERVGPVFAISQSPTECD